MHPLIKFLRTTLWAAATLAAGAAMASYPDKPIKLIVPYAPGGITDNLGRALAEGVGRELKQPIVVENKAGASAMIGTGMVANAPADGYTLLMASNGNMTVTPLVLKNLTYDPIKALRVIAIVAEIPTVAVTNLQTPVTDLRSFAAYAKANDGKLNYASLGQGNVLYLTVRKLESELGIRMTEVPYKGSAPSLTALMANDVQFYVDVLPGALPFIQSGKLKALAVPGDKRIPWLPDVPTLQEAGYNKFHAVSWLGWAVPSATPPEVVSKLQEAIGRFAQNENFRATFTKAGVLMLPAMTPAQVDDYLRADRERWGALIREHNISIDQ
ncbi:tripartite tricarboxylate transporter substrate binding protein [Ottowia sp.]|uniref:tripartite tricarboxylate transporter substrate binding protein n=1 Tax=Ottowia sp. TaxID=1898956 RepID=UPI003961C561|nr:tripartite tricarboxylate transporter substrate binding protein [Pseudomonadota bacterium]